MIVSVSTSPSPPLRHQTEYQLSTTTTTMPYISHNHQLLVKR